MYFEQLNAMSICSSVTVRQLPYGDTAYMEMSGAEEAVVSEFIDRFYNQRIYKPWGSTDNTRTIPKNAYTASDLSFMVISLLDSQGFFIDFLSKIPGMIVTKKAYNRKNGSMPILFVISCREMKEYLDTIREDYKDVKPLNDFREDPKNFQ